MRREGVRRKECVIYTRVSDYVMVYWGIVVGLVAMVATFSSLSVYCTPSEGGAKAPSVRSTTERGQSARSAGHRRAA